MLLFLIYLFFHSKRNDDRDTYIIIYRGGVCAHVYGDINHVRLRTRGRWLCESTTMKRATIMLSEHTQPAYIYMRFCSSISFIKLKREHAIALTSSGVKCCRCHAGNANANEKKKSDEYNYCEKIKRKHTF